MTFEKQAQAVPPAECAFLAPEHSASMICVDVGGVRFGLFVFPALYEVREARAGEILEGALLRRPRIPWRPGARRSKYARFQQERRAKAV